MKFSKSSGSVDVEFILIQGSKSTLFIGLYIFGNFQDGQGLSTNQCVKQIQCVNKNEVSVQVQMPLSGGQYVVMPVTFKAGETNDFELIVHTEEKVTLFEVDGNAQGMRATTKVDFGSKPNTKKPSGYARFGHIKDGGGSKQIELKPEKAPKQKEPAQAPPKAPKPYTPPAKSEKEKTPKAKGSPAPKPQHHSQSHSTPLKQSKGGGGGILDFKSPRVSNNSKGDVLLSFGGSGGGSRSKSSAKGGSAKTTKETQTTTGPDGKKHKQTTITTTVTTFRCGGCGASQSKNSHQCSSCGAKLKKQ